MSTVLKIKENEKETVMKRILSCKKSSDCHELRNLWCLLFMRSIMSLLSR